MKKLLILVLLLIPSVSFAAFDSNLKYGSKGDAVVELQEFLTDQGLYTGPVTGNFYSLTRSAVKRFQTLYSITPAAGYFGPISRAKAVELLDVGQESVQEAIETGTTTPPIVIATIPAPAPVPAPAPAPVVAPEPAVATSTSISVHGPTPAEVLGASCEPARIRVSVLDQYGAEMPGQLVIMNAPYQNLTLRTTSEHTGNGVRTYATFYYNTPATSTIEQISFSSGSLRTSVTLNVRSGLYGRTLPIEGFRVDPDTLLCY